MHVERQPAGVARPPAAREALALLAGALLSIAPVLAAPPQFSPRNGMFLLVGLFLAALALAMPVIARWRGAPLALAAAAAAGAVVASAQFTTDVRDARGLRAVLVAQDRMLRAAAAEGRRDVEVPPLAAPVPATIHAIELGTDPARWDNRCVARYYGLASVRRAKEGP